MEKDRINASELLSMLRAGTSRLYSEKEAINDLNVFPIPDGDTGDNMYMTISDGCRNASGDSVAAMSKSAADGMLLGARGNSGVILSRIFAGMAKGLSGAETAGTEEFKAAMAAGVKEAYGAVAVPVEGTILTVLRESVQATEGRQFEDLCQYLEALTASMRQSLDRTPDLLPVLKEAGVVDSGGAGLICIFEGMAQAFSGVNVGDFVPDEQHSAAKLNLDDFGPDSALQFGYCTEVLLRLQTAKVGDVASFDETPVKEYLNSAGESVVCFREGSVIKVHVHTFTPGEILNNLQRWGEFLTIKVENMALQHNEAVSRGSFRKHQRYGVVAVASGEGLVRTFKEAGVDEVIDGGQTMNPSTEDFIRAFDRIPADTIFVFPNNSNITMAARQAAGLYGKAEIIVIPSDSIGAGYVAAAALDRSSGSAREIEEAAVAAMETVSTVMVSRATRDADMGGVYVSAGQYIGFEKNRIICSSPSRLEAALKAADGAGAGSHEVSLIFSGKEVTAEESDSLVAGMEKSYPRTEFILVDGSQEIYDYIIVLC